MKIINHKETQEQNVRTLVDTLQVTLNYTVSPDLEGLSHMLIKQSRVLDMVFQRLLLDGDEDIETNNSRDNFPIKHHDDKYYSALKAQDLCRRTVKEFRYIKKEHEKEIDETLKKWSECKSIAMKNTKPTEEF